MADQIVPGLWIGDRTDAAAWKGDARLLPICVMENQPKGSMDLWLPPKAVPAMLAMRLELGNIVLLYSGNPDTRAAAAAAAFLMKRDNLTVEQAYILIKQKRSTVVDKRELIL